MDRFFQNSKDKSFIISMIDKGFSPESSGDIASNWRNSRVEISWIFETVLINFL